MWFIYFLLILKKNMNMKKILFAIILLSSCTRQENVKPNPGNTGGTTGGTFMPTHGVFKSVTFNGNGTMDAVWEFPGRKGLGDFPYAAFVRLADSTIPEQFISNSTNQGYRTHVKNIPAISMTDSIRVHVEIFESYNYPTKEFQKYLGAGNVWVKF